MRRKRSPACAVTILALVVLGVGAAPADAYEPFPTTSITPANGGYALPGVSVGFQVESPIDFDASPCGAGSIGGSVHVVVSTEDALAEASEELATIDEVEQVEMSGGKTVPGQYNGIGSRVLPESVYYWQVSGVCFISLMPDVHKNYVSPVYSFTVGLQVPGSTRTTPETTPVPTPPSRCDCKLARPTLSVTEAYSAVKGFIRARLHEAAQHLIDRCVSESKSVVKCKARWALDRRLSSSSLLYAGDFNVEKRSDGIYYAFRGLRETASCARRHGVKHCASSIHWP